MLGHYLTVPRYPEGEEKKLQNKPNTDLEALIDFYKDDENDGDYDVHEGSD